MTGEKRSVIKVGNITMDAGGVMLSVPRSYQITLPKWWCRKHGYPESVYVSEEKDGTLRVKVAKDAS